MLVVLCVLVVFCGFVGCFDGVFCFGRKSGEVESDWDSCWYFDGFSFKIVYGVGWVCFLYYFVEFFVLVG